MTDLADKILEAIDRTEKAAKRALEGRYTWPEAVGFIVDDCTDDDLDACHVHALMHAPTIVLHRCAADRDLVALWRVPDPHGPEDQCESCLALRIVARGYGVQPDLGDDHA